MKSFQRQIARINSRYKENTTASNSSSVYVSNINQNKGGKALLLIDPQYDFIDGSLAVKGAKEDCNRVAEFIKTNKDNLQNIYVTLDSHLGYHIAHRSFWRNAEGKHPPNFTQITFDKVKRREWFPVHKEMERWALYYTRELEKPRLKGLNALTLTIWPEHCLIGTKGHNVDVNVQEALDEWERHNGNTVHYILKGNNSKTEHYSAFRAEVIVDEDPATYFNYKLFNNLKKHSKIYVAGEAKSHCVNFTVRDLVEKLGKQAASDKVILLEDAMSSVTGAEELGKQFVKDMQTLNGVKVSRIDKNGSINVQSTRQSKDI